MTARAGIIYDNFVQSVAGVSEIDLSLFGVPLAGTAASLIDGDSSIPLVHAGPSPAVIRISFGSATDCNILAFINHGFKTADTVTLTVYENFDYTGASEVVLAAVNPADTFDVSYNDYWLFAVTDGTIVAQGGPRSIRVDIAYTDPPSTPQIGQLVIGNTIIPPHTGEGLAVNYSYGYSQSPVVNRAANRTIGGQIQAFAVSQFWAFDRIFIPVANEVTRQQIVTALARVAHSRPFLWIPALSSPECYWVSMRESGINIAVPRIYTLFEVGPINLDEQPHGILV